MKILMFNYEYPPLGGGGGLVHSWIAEHLAERHDVLVVSSNGPGLPSTEVRGGVELHRVPVAGRDSKYVASLASMLSYVPSALAHWLGTLHRQEFDVVNGHFAVPTGPVSVLVARLSGLPHVMSLHGGDIYDPSKRLSPHRIAPLRAPVRMVLRASDAVVANSTDVAAATRKFYGYGEPIDIIPLGIPEPSFTRVSREDLGLPSSVPIAVTIGRLIERKGLQDLIRSVVEVSNPKLNLVVVGSGPLLEPLRDLVEDLGAEEQIYFTGFVEDAKKWQILACADLYAAATMHEGFGLVFLEAMLAGLPVITYDEGGHTDFLEDGVTGFLIKAGDRTGLTAALQRLAADSDLAKRMGRENRRRAARYTAARCARSYEKLFERLVMER